jgi:hypothetical protein
MSESTYTLLSWKGEEQGQFTTSDIRRMWESEEISGLYQVVTDSGNMTVQEFISFKQEQTEKELLQQQQLAQAQAEADRHKFERERLENEKNQRLELESMKAKQEKVEQERLDEEMSGKIYYLYMDGQKKGPYSKENLQVMHQGGKIDESTQVWTKDLGEWVDLKGFQEIVGNSGVLGPFPQSPPQYPPQYGSSPSQPPGRFNQPMGHGGGRRIGRRQPTQRILKPHRGTLILVLGLLGLFCFGILTAIPAWVMGSSDLDEMDAGLMDPLGRGSTSAGKIMGMIVCILTILYLVAVVLLAILA